MTKGMTVGLDLAKNVFFLVTLAGDGHPVGRKKLSRQQMLTHFARLEPCRVAMEACGSSHYWARELTALGHEVQLLPAQHVKAYRRGQKNDYNDAEAIAEACWHGRLRAVHAKSIEEQDRQSLDRIRRLLVQEQTALINQTRGLLAEYGLVIPRSKAQFQAALPRLLDDTETRLSPVMRELMQRQWQRYRTLREELGWYDRQLKALAESDPRCRLLQTVPGIGPVVATAFVNHVGDGRTFARGRDVAASVGLVPGQHSSGDRTILLGISKRGDKILRSLLIHGARSVVRQAHRKTDALSVWIQHLEARRGHNRTVVALANKLARIGWAVLVHGQPYRTRDTAVAIG